MRNLKIKQKPIDSTGDASIMAVVTVIVKDRLKTVAYSS